MVSDAGTPSGGEVNPLEALRRLDILDPGTAADIMKKAMIDVQRALEAEQLKSRILLQVHDELVLEVTEDEKDKVAELVQEAMENAVTLEIPLLAEVSFGKNWAETK